MKFDARPKAGNRKFDDPEALRRYRELQAERPELFANPPSCPIEILLDSDEISLAQKTVHVTRGKHGMSLVDLRVGLLAEDDYIGYVARDAVRFADGNLGLYNRVIASGGILVLPILGDSIALIRIFRHAPRRWMLEAPQGFLPAGADPAEQTKQELMEEMGALATELIPLGAVYTSTAMTSENLKMYAARIASVGKPQRSEGIESIEIVANADIDHLLLDGTICDGPTTSLITHCRVRGLL